MAKDVSRMGGAINRAIRNSFTSVGRRSTIRCHNTEATNTEFEHLSYTEKDLEAEESLKVLFERWRCHYNEGLDWDVKEKTYRFKVFKENAKFIHEFNKQSHSSTLGLNQFAAMTNEEFGNTYCGGRAGSDHKRVDPIEPCRTESELDHGAAADGNTASDGTKDKHY